MDDALMYVYGTIWKIGLLFIIVWTGIYFISSNDLNEITKAYVEISGVQGGFTKQLYEEFEADLSEIGFDPSETTINIKALAPDESDISTSAKNITPIDITPYPSNPKYLPRGTKISIEVISQKKSLLNEAFRFVGIESAISKGYTKKVYMSERVQ